MSGRVRILRDGQWITGYRKTDRRNPRKDPRERLNEIAAGTCEFPVRIAFRLPKTLDGFVGGGRHGLHIETWSRGFVRVSHHSADQCFTEARRFLAAIAKERPAFTTNAVVIRVGHDRTYNRYLTVISGVMVVSAGGLNEPKVYE
jgi:hypothetical protein